LSKEINIMVKKLIINADDLGFSPGVNQAILETHLGGFLSHASLMANTEYFNHAIEEIIPQCKNLKVGVHVNLTCAKALFPTNVLTEKGFLNNTFVSLLFKIKSKKVLNSLENEIEMQILKIKNAGIEISHIDGHEHVHIIPSVNKIVRKLAKKHSIKRVREINENFFTSFKYNLKTASFANIIKLLLLKFLSIFNQNKNEVQFYSILNTCEINAQNLFDYLENTQDQNIEIMLHPSKIELDKDVKNLELRFIDFLNSKFRTQEFELCFNEKFRKFT
jgi:predicted glycoside hydrolase/deacetylase ChbG (UPF0249 family)